MTVVPGVIPLTIPVAGPMVAIAGLLLLHVPPGVASVNIVVPPVQAPDNPIIGVAVLLTVIVVVAAQPANGV